MVETSAEEFQRQSTDPLITTNDNIETEDDLRQIPDSPLKQLVPELQPALQAIVSLANNVMNMPACIWLLDPHSQRLKIQAAIGLIRRYTIEASATLGDGSNISQVVQTGEAQAIHDIPNDNRFHYPDHARTAGWASVLGFPIKFRGQTSGVIELFSGKPQDFGQDVLDALRRVADLATLTIENAYHAREYQKLAQVAHALSASPDFRRAMRVIVESARELTGADSSTIFLLEKRTNSFAVGSHAAAHEQMPASLPRAEGGLTRYIVEDGTAIKIDDTSQDRRVRAALEREGTYSVLGVRIQMEEERIGVLYVNGRRKAQFTDHDVRLLQTLADQASMALGWARVLLRPSGEIEEATSDLFRLEATLDDLWHDLRSSLGFEFAAVQLVRQEEQIIETVYGTGTVEQWTGRVKHSLEQDPDLRDIQADIAVTRRTDIISGWDRRFDRWVYDAYHHERFVRVFTPIILVRDARGNVINDWFEHCHWEVVAEEENKAGRCTTLKLQLINGDGEGEPIAEVIGTLEVGYQDPEKHISIEEAITLNKLLARQALNIRRALLPYVLEVIVERAKRIVRADAATLHFLYEPRQQRYIYQVGAGPIGQRLVKASPPRVSELGRQAIQENKPMFLPDLSRGNDNLDIERLDPQAFIEGIHAIAAFPLLIDEKEGVLYIYFEREHQFTEDEIDWVDLFAHRAVDAIRHATTYTQMRDRARQLRTLHALAQYLVTNPEEPNLLNYIAGSTLNILAADVVTIYEYIEAERRFATPIGIAGRLSAEQFTVMDVDKNSTPALLIEYGRNVYAEKAVADPILNNPDRKRITGIGEPFAIRERIESSAGILLKVGTETVGAMFISYRRPHRFSEDDHKNIDTLASSAAIAIKNRRLLTLSTIEREIITTADLDEIPGLIVKLAVANTGADVGNIRRLDPASQELVVQAKYPTDVSVDSTRSRTKLVEGITGWVAIHRVPMLVDDVSANPLYTGYFPNLGSLLSVPLLDRDERVLGVLTVGRQRLEAFNRKDQRVLEGLANLAVIAIKNAEQQKQLVAAKTMARLGDLTGPLIHRMTNDVSAIRVLAQEIREIEGVDKRSIAIAAEIQSVAERVRQEARSLNSWILEQPIDLRQAVSRALSRLRIPANIRHRNAVPKNLPKVPGGEDQMMDVLVNLIQNAIDAMPNGGKVSISGKSVDLEGRRWVLLSMRDTGAGIADEDQEQIFQRNYSKKAGEKGLGFGLWWARTYIERLGGQLTVTSRLGQGAKFTVMLPAYEPEV